MNGLNRLLLNAGSKIVANWLVQKQQEMLTDVGGSNDEPGLSTKDQEMLKLKKKDGGIILILGKRESGKTVLAHRVADFLRRPTYAISPSQQPPNWIIKWQLDMIDEIPPNSTLILDDLPVYMSTRDYHEGTIQSIERLIPVARHRKMFVIFVSQTSGFADRWCMDADVVFIKQMSILYADIERPAVKKLMDRAAPYFKDRPDMWVKKHAFMVTDSWEGLIKVNMVI